MRILRPQGALAIGATAALVGAIASGQVACSSSSSPVPPGFGSSSGGASSSGGSGSGSGGTEDDGGDSGGSGSGGGSSGGGEAGEEPTITITSPTSGSTVMPTGANDAVSVAFTTTSFTFFAPGASGCSASSDNCGHVDVFVDGTACTPMGSQYDNTDTTGSPAQAILSTCSTVDGMHKISVELHHADDTPIQVGGMTIQDSIKVAAGG
jgi:hypothetical protein